MGDPAQLTPKEKAEAVRFAFEIIKSVKEDRTFPIKGITQDDAFKILELAQVLVEYCHQDISQWVEHGSKG